MEQMFYKSSKMLPNFNKVILRVSISDSLIHCLHEIIEKF